MTIGFDAKARLKANPAQATEARRDAEESCALQPEEAVAQIETKRAAVKQARQRDAVEQNSPSTEPHRDGPRLGVQKVGVITGHCQGCSVNSVYVYDRH